MKNFTYYRPATIKEAVGLLDAKWGTTELLGGGTDLHDLQKEYVAQPDKVVSVSGIKDFKGIQPLRGAPENALLILAGTTLAEIADDKMVKENYPALATASGEIGGPQIRNMGTLGGNLCQRNRCWYFRDEHVNCLLKGGDKCFALDGDNRYHAVFAQGHKCVIVNPSTLAPVLIALGAKVDVQGPRDKRSLKMEDFFQAPSTSTQREHVLAPNELIVSVTLPRYREKNASYEVRHKQAYDWPLVQAAVAFKYDGGKASNVKIVLGHVAPIPIVADDAAKSLEGKAVTEETATEAGKAATKGAKPLAENGYKIKLVEVAVKRALITASGQKKYWE
ncbi:MAG TPA: xanthine dehydrogenase family protein subunit M [Gemmataceae bacterium]|jgi:xanthine dehydrogenase YagS FAD-binding subunit|nr:xanthine dehydrogenase family protein subunit M [Gemmataceae bacterium]